MQPRRRLAAVIVTFVSLGMPHAALAVAWPTMADELGRSIGDLGTIAVVHTLGYGFVTLVSGRLIAAFGVGRLLAVCGWISSAALAGYLVAGSWIALLAAVLVHGIAGAGFDAGLNAYAAMEMDSRAMNLLHAGFGLGATLGPWLMAFALAIAGWRLGMGAIAIGVGLVATMLTITRHTWSLTDDPEGAVDERSSPGFRPIVALTLLVFVFYTGVELSIGNWGYTLLTEGRGVSVNLAGFAAGSFWAGLTLSRLAMGVVANRFAGLKILAVSGLGVLAGSVLLWLAPDPWLSVAGLACAGLACGPIFPLQTSLTPRRVGRRAAPTMIGYQIAAATVGGGGGPWLIGNSVDAFGVESIGVIVALLAAGMVLGDWVLRRETVATDSS